MAREWRIRYIASMCGITGIIQLQKDRAIGPLELDALRAMLARLGKRGPDDQQITAWGRVGFGFARLSIVDLEHGRQPIANEDKSLLVMVNGELYNHKDLRSELREEHHFQSNTDSEILVHLFEERGIQAVEALNGIFGAAIFDSRRQKLFLVRDRLGVKPLYYYKDERVLVFASEIKALLAHPDVPKRFDWASAMQEMTTQGFAQPARPLVSMFEGIEYLAAGMMLELDLDSGRHQVRPYWDLQRFVEDPYGESIDAEAHIERYRELLADSVRLQLMADVEYGLFLSGGIDSVAIAALASKHSRFHTFTVMGQSTLGNGDAASAHRAAQVLGLPNHQVFFDFRNVLASPEEWKQILWDCEFYSTNAEQLYKYKLHAYAKEIRPELKVILLGQGSDEFNGGYIQTMVAHQPEADWDYFDHMSLHAQEGYLRRGQQILGLEGVMPQGLLMANQFPAHALPNLLQQSFLAGLRDQHVYHRGWDVYRDMYRRTMQMYQLWHEDRTASANSIESRVPFLDHRIVEHVCRIPARHHAELFWRKDILRKAMVEYLPKDLCERKKVPFFYGDDLRYTHRLIHNMLCANDGQLIEEAIAASDAAGGVFHGDMLRRIIKEMPQDPEYNAADRVLELVNMALLSRMAIDPPALRQLPSGVSEISIENWDSWAAEFAPQLTARKAELSLSSIPKFSEDILLVRCEGGDPSWADPGAYYVLEGSTLKFMIEAEQAAWIRFLLAVDGQRSVEQALESSGSTQAEVWKHLEEAMEQKVLCIENK